jgi:hypothetical protein
VHLLLHRTPAEFNGMPVRLPKYDHEHTKNR